LPGQQKFNINVQDRQGGPLRLDFGKVDDIRKKLREGFDLWTSADMPGGGIPFL